MADLRIKASASSTPGGAALGRHSSMLGALIKKQFMELSTLFSFGKKRTQKGSTGGFAITMALYILIALSVGAGMMGMALPLSDQLLGKGEDWKYFMLLDMLGVGLATLITMFNADLTLFRAKDNEILLSMPIPPGYILIARMLPLYFIALVLTGSVVVPEILIYRQTVGMGFGLVLLNVLILLILGLLSLALSSILGWLVSLINARLKGNSIASMILSLLFLGIYFFVYFQMSKFSAALVARSGALAETIRKVLPPLYFIGKAHIGSISGILIGGVSIVVVFGVIYFALSRTFRSVAINSSKGSSHTIGRSVLRTGSQDQVLLGKEFRRFTTSTSYMMNCGLGSVFMIVFAVAAVIKREALLSAGDFIRENLDFSPGLVPMALLLLIFAMVSTCYYTMPSISLEGKNIWILQAAPIDPMKIFIAKIKMEYILCLPGILILDTAVSIVLKLGVLTWAAVLVASLAYTTFTAFFGLWINLLRPSLDWTNEAYPIKQGLNPLICLFGEWLLTLILGGIYFLVGLFLPGELYMLFMTVVLLLVSYVFWRWLHTSGRARFAAL